MSTPSGVVTFLFTDIEGSTRRWESDAAAMRLALAAHDIGLIGFLAENYEPTSWAEELIDAARAVDHPRLVWLYQAASVCYQSGRSEQGVAYAEATRGVKPKAASRCRSASRAWQAGLI